RTSSLTPCSRQKSRQIASTTAVESTRVPSMSNRAAAAVTWRVDIAGQVYGSRSDPHDGPCGEGISDVGTSCLSGHMDVVEIDEMSGDELLDHVGNLS